MVRDFIILAFNMNLDFKKLITSKVNEMYHFLICIFVECFDMLKVPGKCEHKRNIGKCISNPWRMMSVCKKTCYCEGK